MPGGGQRSQQGLGAGAQGLVLGLLVYEANGHAQGLGGAFHLLDGDAASVSYTHLTLPTTPYV